MKTRNIVAQNAEGYANLLKLSSASYTEGFYYKPRIDKEILAQHAKGLIGLSSCLKGEVATGIRTEQAARAMRAAATYRDILGDFDVATAMRGARHDRS